MPQDQNLPTKPAALPKPTGKPDKVRDEDLELFKKQNGLWSL
jgi:hypothetical protein